MPIEASLRTHTPGEEEILRGARQVIYQFLSLATSDPRADRWERLLNPEFLEGAELAADFLVQKMQAVPYEPAPGELPVSQFDLRPILGFLAEMSLEELIQSHDRVYTLVISKECPPYETEYCPQTFSINRSNRLADVAGFYKAFGVEPSRDHPERQDHISLELEFMAWLFEKEEWAGQQQTSSAAERGALCREAQVAFFREHLVWWVPAFAMALRKKDNGDREGDFPTQPPTSFHYALGALLGAFVGIERALLGLAPPTELLEPATIPLVATDMDEECGGCADSF